MPPDALAAEAAWALADLAAREAPAVLPACRRLLERHPDCGPLWWVAARVVGADDPAAEAEWCAAAIESDPTPELLVGALGELRVVRRGGVGDVASADVVLVPASAIGPDAMAVEAGCHGLLEAARTVGVPIWVESGVGRVLPGRLWASLVRRVGRSTEPSGRTVSVLRSSWFDDGPGASIGIIEPQVGVTSVVGPSGPVDPDGLALLADCSEPPGLVDW